MVTQEERQRYLRLDDKLQGYCAFLEEELQSSKLLYENIHNDSSISNDKDIFSLFPHAWYKKQAAKIQYLQSKLHMISNFHAYVIQNVPRSQPPRLLRSKSF